MQYVLEHYPAENTASPMVSLMRCMTGSTRYSSNFRYTLAFADFTTKGQKVLRFSPQKQPQTITETPLPFPSVLCIQFSIFRWCSEYPDLVYNIRLLHRATIAPNNPLKVLCRPVLRSLAHFRRLAARSGVNFGRCFASHSIIPFFRRYRSIIASDTSGAHSSCSCSRVSFRLRLIIRQMCRRLRLVSFSGLPDLGRFSI